MGVRQVSGSRGGGQALVSSPRPMACTPGPLCLRPRLPSGLEDVSKYPDLIAELLRRQWTEAEVKGALAENLLRVFEAVEQVRSCLLRPAPPHAGDRQGTTCVCPQASDHTQTPEEEPIPLDKLEGSCRTTYGYSGAPSLHRPPGTLLASLVPLLFSLYLL